MTPAGPADEPAIVKDARAAIAWIVEALNSSGYRVDYSFSSLKEIDRFFDEQTSRRKPKPGGLLSERLGSRLFAIGCYVGEVIRREGGGAWEGNDGDPAAEINIAVRRDSGMVFWPVQRVMNRMRNGKEDGIFAYGIGLTLP